MPRASWRGFLRLSLVSCPIYLSPATTRVKSIRLHQVWQPAPVDVAEDALSDQGEGQQGSAPSAPRLLVDDASLDGDQSPAATRVTLRPHDPATGEEIDKREVVKGYEYARGEFVTFTAEELKALDVESSKVIDLEKFVPRNEIDPVYFDSSYYLYPDGPIAVETLRGDRRGNRRGRSRRARAPHPQPARADGHGRAERYRDGAVHTARCKRCSGTTIQQRRGRPRCLAPSAEPEVDAASEFSARPLGLNPPFRSFAQQHTTINDGCQYLW